MPSSGRTWTSCAASPPRRSRPSKGACKAHPDEPALHLALAETAAGEGDAARAKAALARGDRLLKDPPIGSGSASTG